MHLTKLASIQLATWKMIESSGIDPGLVFKKIRLDPDLMYQPGARYPLSKIFELWQEVERIVVDPCIGLMAADPKCCHPSYFGTLGYAMLVSKSLRVTLERLIRFHRVISDVNFGRLNENREAKTLVFSLINIEGAPYTRIQENAALAWLMSILRMNFQDDIAAVEINFTHGSIECSSKFIEYFKSPVHFNTPVCSLALPLDVVDRILPSYNEELVQFNDQIMSKYLTDMDKKDLLIKVRKIIVEHLPSGNATLENTANELGYSPRTLQRLLKNKGISFITLLNEVRMDIAKQYVRDNNKDLTEVAFLLGFSELSSFSRSFKRWTGKSLRHYRKAV